MKWYRQAAEGGDKRATRRLASNNKGGPVSALDRRLEMEAMKDDLPGRRKGSKDQDNCVIM